MSSTLQLQTNPKIEGAWAHIRYDDPPVVLPDGSVDGDWDERRTNTDGYTAFMFVEGGRQAFVLIRAKGYRDVYVPPIDMPHDALVTVDLEALPVPPMLRLRVEGRHFVTDAGRVPLRMADCFCGADRFEAGENLRPIFAQLQDKGFNAIRVLGMYKNIADQLGRPPYTANPAKIRAFCQLAADYGLYVHWVVFADTGLVMPTVSLRVPYFLAVVDALKHEPNTLGSRVNEPSQHENDCGPMPRPSGIAFSNGSEEVTLGPWWDFDEFHPRRDYPAAIKDCCVVDHPNYVEHGMAMLIDEPDRFGSDGNPNAEQCALQAGASVESAAGIAFHSKRGIYAQLFDAETERCADAFIRALKGL